jgi:4-amino-4-deoxy-L-arabinose transferase-like glycosyltransferase
MPGSVWHAVTRAGRLIQPDPNLQAQFNTAPSEFYLLGRLLTITYGVLSIPLVYRIGRRAFTRRVGFIGAWFATLSFLPVVYAQMVRTDSAAAFWGALSLLFCLKLYDHPTTKNHVCAGIAIGLGIASRYFLVALIPILFATSVLILLCQTSNRLRTPINWKGMVMGFLAVAFAFALSTPYFFLDSATAREDLSTEARSTHLGADGLSPLGNLRWYLTTAIPLSMSWPQAILAVLGIALIAWHHKPKQLLLLGFSVIFLAGISLLSQ